MNANGGDADGGGVGDDGDYGGGACGLTFPVPRHRWHAGSAGMWPQFW